MPKVNSSPPSEENPPEGQSRKYVCASITDVPDSLFTEPSGGDMREEEHAQRDARALEPNLPARQGFSRMPPTQEIAQPVQLNPK